jgi:hypothetical protein
MAYADLSRRQQNLLDRLAMRTEAGRESSPQLERMLSRSGIADEDMTGLLAEADPEDALTRIAQRGAQGGRRAAMLRNKMAVEDNLAEIERLEPLARTRMTDEIAAGYSNLPQELASLLGGPVDPNSEALQALGSRWLAGRQTSMDQAMSGLEERSAALRMDVKSQGAAFDRENLIGMGDVAEMLKRLDEEEDALAATERGFLFGSLMPGPIGIGLGAASGGRQGAMGGLSGTFNTAAFAAQLFGSFGGTGRGGSLMPNGGTGTSPLYDYNNPDPYQQYTVF